MDDYVPEPFKVIVRTETSVKLNISEDGCVMQPGAVGRCQLCVEDMMTKFWNLSLSPISKLYDIYLQIKRIFHYKFLHTHTQPITHTLK